MGFGYKKSWPFSKKDNGDVAETELPEVQLIALDKISAGRLQPRDHFNNESLAELASSIKTQGVLQPIVLNMEGEKYSIIAGERRYRASQIAGLSKIPAIIKQYDDKTALEVALIENVQREDLSPIAEAKGYKRLMDEFSYTQEQISTRTGKSRSHVANIVRLNQLPMQVQDMVADKKITLGHAKSIAGLENAAAIAQKIVGENLSVRATEELVKNLSEGINTDVKIDKVAIKKSFDETNKQRSEDIARLEEILSGIIGARTTLSVKSKNGKIMIEYKDMDHLDNIISRLSKM